MKTFLIVISFLVSGVLSANACTYDSIQRISGTVNPYESSSVAAAYARAIDTLSLCDENQYFAGEALGKRFNSYEGYASQMMARTAQSRIRSMNPDFARGMALGIVDQVNVYERISTSWMVWAVVEIARVYRTAARELAFKLSAKDSSYEEDGTSYIRSGVASLIEIAKSVNPPDNGGGGGGNPPQSMWSFRSEQQTCVDYYSGPWGTYYACPKYTASVADAKGNRLILNCSSQNAGIEFRVQLGREMARLLVGKELETFSFGTDKLQQIMGVPYFIQQANALYSGEVLAPEILDHLAADRRLVVGFRLNAGESNLSLNFSLGGSNAAIKQLKQVCQ